MRNRFNLGKSLATFAALACVVAAPALAVEVIVEEDFVEGIVVEDQLVRLADNAIFLVDTSSSMNEEYRDTGRSKLDVVLEEFKKRERYFPEIGHKFGVYEYTPWKVVFPVQTFQRGKIAAAVDTIPERGKGATPLAIGIKRATEVISQLSGRTVLFLFYDGKYTGESPDPAIWRLIRENDVCLLMISSADEDENDRLRGNLAKLNACSRLIPLENFLDRPEYTTNALFDVRATEKVITTSQKRVAGVRVENIVFGFDKTDLTSSDKEELDELGEFMSANPESYAVLAGYTDNVGVEDYNENLSRERTRMVASYLMNEHGIDGSRLVLQWHGSDNPIASNDTAEGRAANRRVEVAVGGV